MPRYNLTALRLYIGALACSVPSPVRYSQARTFSTIITTIQMKEDIVNTSTSPKETRSVFVGAKVTPSQRDHIKSLAKQCGMTTIRIYYGNNSAKDMPFIDSAYKGIEECIAGLKKDYGC